MPAPAATDPLYVKSLEKGLAVLRLFESADGPLSLTEIAALTGHGVSAAQRFTHTLEKLGYLEKNPRTRRFRPGLKAIGLSAGYGRVGAVPEAGRDVALALADRLGESVGIDGLDGAEVVHVLRIPDPDASTGAGPARSDISHSAAGRAMLSHLSAMDAVGRVFSAPRAAPTAKSLRDPQRIVEAIETARTLGYALVDEERNLGEIALAAAVVNPAGEPVAALEVTAPRARWKWRKARERLASAVIEAADTVTARLAALD